MHQIKTGQTNEPEIIDFTSKGVTSGTILLKVYKTLTTGVIDQNATIPWNANATEFCKGLNAFDWFKLSSFGVSCAVTMKDSTGGETVDVKIAVEFTWRVTIDKIRSYKG